MRPEEKFWLGIWGIIAITVIILGSISAIYKFKIHKIAFENGYEKISLIGYSSPVYHKVTEVK